MVDMVIIDGIRYRPEDAPKVAEPEPVEAPAPEKRPVRNKARVTK